MEEAFMLFFFAIIRGNISLPGIICGPIWPEIWESFSGLDKSH